MSGAPVLHATLVARRFSDGWRGVLLRGPSGAGKSDLALRAMAAGFRLVADDRVLAWASGGRAWGRAPGVLRGLIEARHLGVAACGAIPLAPIALVIDLVDAPPERLPDPAVAEIAGVGLPRLDLRAFEPCTPARLLAALEGERRRIVAPA